MAERNIVINKKIKNIIITLVEILIVSVIIMGALMFVQKHLKGGNSSGFFSGRQDGENQEEKKESQKKEKNANKYLIEVNINKSAMIIYKCNADKSDKKALNVYAASVGEDVEAGKYSVGSKYQWHQNGDVWNKYNTYFTGGGRISSADYYDKYSWTMVADSYLAIGSGRISGNGVQVCSEAAQWIFANCDDGTEVSIVEGKKKDKLPLQVKELKKNYTTCGWEPTDPDAHNPYNSIKKGSIAVNDTVYVEKGEAPDYLSNVIALDRNGRNISNKLNYDGINYNSTGEYKVQYVFDENKLKLKAELTYKVVDTIVPRVSVPDRLVLELDNVEEKYIKTDKVKTQIEDMVRAKSSASEGSIIVNALPKEQLKEGDNYVYVMARDSSGNVGSAQTVVEIVKKKEVETTTKKEPTTKQHEKTTSVGQKPDTEKVTTRHKGNENTTTKKVDSTTKHKPDNITTKPNQAGGDETTGRKEPVTEKDTGGNEPDTKETESSRTEQDTSRPQTGGEDATDKPEEEPTAAPAANNVNNM